MHVRKRSRTVLAAAAVACLALPSVVAAETVHGDLRIRAPGVVHVGGYVVHLLGVQALGSIGISQFRQEGIGDDRCPDGIGGEYQCGVVAMARMAETTVGYSYTCEVERFQGDVRNWGVCRPYSGAERGPIPGLPTLNQLWVQLGWGKADTTRTDMLVPFEEEARAAGRGMWAYPPTEIDPEMPEEVVGPAHVLNGNTVQIGGFEIVLFGTDAPDLNQGCTVTFSYGNFGYGCGNQSRAELIERTMGKRIYCQRRDISGNGINWAMCYEANAAGDGPAEGAVSLNEQMVRDGWARAERQVSNDFVNLEVEANRANVGLHAGPSVLPSNWRRGQR